ncbi:OmpH family outer membrane protein [Algivirga pacifica]|uniref:Periplasmic chaperone for outer membrane proteins Skp n=1 Tax=Algivirga pacifica TaxID=1162670 RepID=A0ABP9D2N7_9BACT
MKKLLVLSITLFISLQLQAQKFGYIDSQVIIEQLPEYKDALGRLDKLTKEWSSEIEKMKKEITSLEQDYRNEELLLTIDMKEVRLEKIEEKKTELRKYQADHFGYEGLLYVKRKEMIKPLQDKIAKAAETVARKNRLSFLFDKASDLTMIYSDPRHNYTDLVLEELELGDPADTPR